MESVGAVDAVLPELAALRGVEQSAYHHLDVYGHTLAVLERGGRAASATPARSSATSTAPRVAALLAEPLADELTRGGALRFGALLHDVAKPQTRAVTRRRGASRSSATTRRAPSSRANPRPAARERAAARARRRAHAPPPAARLPRPRAAAAAARVYRYLKACEPVEVDVTLLSVADRLATRGRRSEEAIAAHLELARELIGAALAWREPGRPAPLVRGDELADALGIEPGPRLGELLAELEEATYAGEVATRERGDRLRRARCWSSTRRGRVGSAARRRAIAVQSATASLDGVVVDVLGRVGRPVVVGRHLAARVTEPIATRRVAGAQRDQAVGRVAQPQAAAQIDAALARRTPRRGP